ncbi:MAG: DNA alkylation repair protein [Bacteroidales bacterium]
MDPKKIYNEVKDFCEAHADAELVKKYSRYFKEGGYDAYGLSKGLLEEKIQEILDREKPGMEEIFETSKLLIPEGKYELPSAALHFFMKRKKEYSKRSFGVIDSWFDIGINNWAHTDAICMELLKNHIQKKIITPADIASWRYSSRPFKRRASLVTMIYFMKDGLSPGEVVAFCDPLMLDPDRVVHQGAGWLLRETWKKHPLVVEEFMIKWKETAPRLIFQYATEKMTKEEKERFRRSK